MEEVLRLQKKKKFIHHVLGRKIRWPSHLLLFRHMPRPAYLISQKCLKCLFFQDGEIFVGGDTFGGQYKAGETGACLLLLRG